MGLSSMALLQLLAVLAVLFPHVQLAVMDMKGQYRCSQRPNNALFVELTAYDHNRQALSMAALDLQNVHISDSLCPVSGNGNLLSAFYVNMTVNMNNHLETKQCGMTIITEGSRKIYLWRFRAVPQTFISNVTTSSGHIFNVTCDTSDLSDGKVESSVNFNVPNLIVSTTDPTKKTGVNSFAHGAPLKITGIVYPFGRNVPTLLSLAKGIYLYNCYTATTDNMQSDRQRFVDQNGCMIAGAAYAATSEFRTTSTSHPFTVEAANATAQNISGNSEIFMACMVGTCNQDNDTFCVDRCAAHNTNTSSTSTGNTDLGVLFTTSFTVKDLLAQDMAPTPAGDVNIVLHTSTVGTQILLVAFNSPVGQGNFSSVQTTQIANAKGFFLYNCRWSIYSTVTASTSTLFVDNLGCAIQGSKFVPVSNFAYDDLTSSPANNQYVLKSGLVTLENMGSYRIWAKCMTGICAVANHNYCKKRCNATDNFPGQTAEMGDIGLEFTMSITDPLKDASLQMNIINKQGGNVGKGQLVKEGQEMALKFTVIPGGKDSVTGTDAENLKNAQGVFVYNCYASRKKNPKESDKIYHIDANGCKIDGSPYSTTSNCLDVTVVKGVKPFQLDCGTFTAPSKGNVYQFCSLGVCTTKNNPYCNNRCAAGALTSNANTLPISVPLTSEYKVDDSGRTAIKAEEIRRTVIAVTVVAPSVFVASVSIVTCIIIKKQMRAAL